ncbi:DUF4760 domain-containing protein [Spiribacter vilamensis]|uniref:DUF4760 domain-containing protein n=1 Tax=Spiribacter vilamensis TaxID=531306 RepID=UPI00102C87E6|nr:hypothetical protein [Spiribacter vilamensis]TVO60191.1 hypothetical protein FPL09_10200 [Spiribacter vilamensis]
MSDYEKWSLALTAIGHLFVASSILYAARSWLVSEKAFERQIQKDTRTYLSDIDSQIRSLQRELHVADTFAESLKSDPETKARINGILSIVESVGYEIDTDFYDSKKIKNCISPVAASVWNRWEPYILSHRAEVSHENLWIQVALLASSYHKALQRTVR